MDFGGSEVGGKKCLSLEVRACQEISVPLELGATLKRATPVRRLFPDKSKAFSLRVEV